MENKETIESCDELDHRQFMIAAKKLANSFTFGADSSPWVSSGIEYVQSRLYQQGDSIKTVDWKLTARTGKLYVKECEAPKQIPVQIILDTSNSMTISSTSKSKYAVAVQIATALALASLEHVRPVGLIGCGSEEVRISPSLSKEEVQLWSHKMRHFQYGERTRLTSVLNQLKTNPSDTSMVIVISDLHDENSITALKHLSTRHELVVIETLDPAEKGKMGGGIYRINEAETGRSLTGHGFSKWFKKGGVDYLEERKHELTKAGIDQIEVITDQPFSAKLRMFFNFRAIGTGRGSQ